MKTPGYQKSLSMKITRTQHRVTFSVGTRAKDLADYLKNVPPDAKIINIDDGTDFSDEAKHQLPFIEFEQENKDGD